MENKNSDSKLEKNPKENKFDIFTADKNDKNFTENFNNKVNISNKILNNFNEQFFSNNSLNFNNKEVIEENKKREKKEKNNNYLPIDIRIEKENRHLCCSNFNEKICLIF